MTTTTTKYKIFISYRAKHVNTVTNQKRFPMKPRALLGLKENVKTLPVLLDIHLELNLKLVPE